MYCSHSIGVSYENKEGDVRMNVMKNWGCLNKIKLVGILLAGGLHFIFLPFYPPSSTLVFHFLSLFFIQEVFHLLDNVIFRQWSFNDANTTGLFHKRHIFIPTAQLCNKKKCTLEHCQLSVHDPVCRGHVKR